MTRGPVDPRAAVGEPARIVESAAARTAEVSAVGAEIPGSSQSGSDPPAAALAVFGPRMQVAQHYADLLCGPGVERGLIGPREAGRVWERHLVNCAVVESLIPMAANVLDVGSGAGLPGIPLALVRPDLSITLLEPMARRVTFLEMAVDALGLEAVRVLRGRAEEPKVRRQLGRHAVVTARAVAPLSRLVAWCRPLVAPGGELLALKGEAAADELEALRPGLTRAGIVDAELVRCGQGQVDVTTTVVRLRVRG